MMAVAMQRAQAFCGKTIFQPEEAGMARIPILDENDPTLDPATREALLEAGRSRGRLVNVYRALANRPEALAVLSQLMQTVYRKNSTLAPQHGELAYMTATSVNDCFY
jgi:alkylhydroperoxidase family enzyme